MDNSKAVFSSGTHTFRRIAGDILIGLISAFTLYLSSVMIYRIGKVVLKGSYIKVFAVEIALCLCMLLLAVDIRSGLLTKAHSRILNALGWILRAAFIAVSGIVLFLSGNVIAGGLSGGRCDAQYAIVLGMALEDGAPTADLLMRLDTSERYLEEHPDAVLILTGGNPDENGKTEADVMHDILSGRGVPDSRMILEDKAETTKKNFENAAEIIGPSACAALITSDYHISRASRNASDAGFSSVQPYPAPSDALFYGANVMWEVVTTLFA